MPVEVGVISTTRSLDVFVLDNMFTSCHPRSNNIRWHWGFLGPTPESVYQVISLTGFTENCHDLQLKVFDIQYHICQTFWWNNFLIITFFLTSVWFVKIESYMVILGFKVWASVWFANISTQFAYYVCWCCLSSIFHYFHAIGINNFTVRNSYAEETQICSVCHTRCVMWVCSLFCLTHSLNLLLCDLHSHSGTVRMEDTSTWISFGVSLSCPTRQSESDGNSTSPPQWLNLVDTLHFYSHAFSRRRKKQTESIQHELANTLSDRWRTQVF